MGTRERDRDRELLIPVAAISENGGSKSSAPTATPTMSSSHGREAFLKVIRSWASKKFMTGCVILLPLAITFYVTWGFVHFVDGFFSPVYNQLGINIFGLGFATSITFIFLVGVFMSSWWGASVLTLGEWFIKKMATCELYLCCLKANKCRNITSSRDILRPNLSVREGIEIVISGGMSVPKLLTTVDPSGIQATRIVNFEASV
ncbi:hypothetical protein CRYUN_Cryun28dG0094200 [Craigia yunnanensis]